VISFEIKTEEEYRAVMEAVNRYRITLYSGLNNPIGTYWKKTTKHGRKESHDWYHVYMTDNEPKLLCISDFDGVTVSSNRSMVNLQATDDPNVYLECIPQEVFLNETFKIISSIGLDWSN